MKSEVKEKESKLNFPCLMGSSNGNIYLITGRNNNFFIGTRIASLTDAPIGEFSNEWVGINQFKWGEDVEVSDDGKEWYKRKLVGMNPFDCVCPFIVVNENGSEMRWKFCRKVLSERAKIEAQIKELQEKLKNF